MHMGKDIKVLLNGKELLVRNVEVTYSVDDLPSVSIEGLLPRDFEQTVEVTVNDSASDVIKKMLEEAQMNGEYIGVDMGSDMGDSMAMAHYAIQDGKIKQLRSTEEVAWTTGDENMRGYAEDSCEKACEDTGSYGAHSLAKKVVNLDLDERQKLIKKYELKQDDGTLTQRGRELLLTLLFDIYEDEVVEALESLEEERKAERE